MTTLSRLALAWAVFREDPEEEEGRAIRPRRTAFPVKVSRPGAITGERLGAGAFLLREIAQGGVETLVVEPLRCGEQVPGRRLHLVRLDTATGRIKQRPGGCARGHLRARPRGAASWRRAPRPAPPRPR